MSLVGDYRPVRFATGGESMCKQVLNRLARHPKLLLRTENS